MTKYFYLFKVSIEKNFKELSRYKFNTISDIIIFYVLFMAMFLGIKSFGISFGISPMDMGSNLEGFVVGYFLWTIMLMAYTGAAYGVMHDANRGTLEQLNMSGIKLSTIVTIRSLSDLLINFIISIVLLFIIMLTTNYKLEIKIFSILLPIFIGIFSILGIGLIFGGLALIFKKVQSLLNIVQYFLIALVMVSPENSIIYNLIPFRPAADKVMLSMMEGYSFIDFSIYDYGIMVGNSILYFTIGLLVFNKCVNLAKRKGLLGQY
ncbi:ABC transporter permease [Tissierella sp.]|uniref:ABC transporter permease n=1 Tax=Tissierella sp. TaxID=41274 RepID=UPI0028ABE73C|nr:ABC transporter permease [Tissierella sp.]